MLDVNVDKPTPTKASGASTVTHRGGAAGHKAFCNGHYNRTPDLGKCVKWWNAWDLARHTILDVKVLDRNVSWLTKHKDTLDTSTRCEDTWLPLVVVDTDKASWQANERR